MLLFLASVIEQLDLALEHIAKGDIHNSRFGLMMTDNAVELMLHQIAKEKASYLKEYSYRQEPYMHQAILDAALGRNFEAKVRFAKIEGKLPDHLAQTINTMHSYRNEIYHIGLKHESILPTLSLFYFDVACEYLSGYQPRSMYWGSNEKIPERAQKYFGGNFTVMPVNFDAFARGCRTLRDTCKHEPARTIATLADEMDQVVEQQDICIAVVAEGVYPHQKTTRDNAVRDTQAWKLAFSNEGTVFAMDSGWSGNRLQLVDWLSDNYPLKFKGDPIPSWTKQAAKMRKTSNPHFALSNYHSFMFATADIREAIEELAAAAEREIDSLIDRSRGK